MKVSTTALIFLLKAQLRDHDPTHCALAERLLDQLTEESEKETDWPKQTVEALQADADRHVGAVAREEFEKQRAGVVAEILGNLAQERGHQAAALRSQISTQIREELAQVARLQALAPQPRDLDDWRSRDDHATDSSK